MERVRTGRQARDHRFARNQIYRVVPGDICHGGVLLTEEATKKEIYRLVLGNRYHGDRFAEEEDEGEEPEKEEPEEEEPDRDSSRHHLEGGLSEMIYGILKRVELAA